MRRFLAILATLAACAVGTGMAAHATSAPFSTVSDHLGSEVAR